LEHLCAQWRCRKSIVNDVAEEVGVGSGGDAFEKAAFDDAAADSQACGLQVLLRPFNDQ
jgi:hypothetical protein